MNTITSPEQPNCCGRPMWVFAPDPGDDIPTFVYCPRCDRDAVWEPEANQ